MEEFEMRGWDGYGDDRGKEGLRLDEALRRTASGFVVRSKGSGRLSQPRGWLSDNSLYDFNQFVNLFRWSVQFR